MLQRLYNVTAYGCVLSDTFSLLEDMYQILVWKAQWDKQTLPLVPLKRSKLKHFKMNTPLLRLIIILS